MMGDEYMNRMDNFLANKESQIEALVNKKLEIEDKIVVDRLEMAKVEKEISKYDNEALNEQVITLMHENEKLAQRNRALEKALKEVDDKTFKIKEDGERSVKKL